jgi:hypothetical protein
VYAVSSGGPHCVSMTNYLEVASNADSDDVVQIRLVGSL